MRPVRMLTSQFLSINTDFDSLKTITVWLKPNHPNWIGAWWLPFIIFGIIAAIFAALISLFPKRLNHDRRNHAEKSEIFKESKVIGNENGKANGTVPANEESRNSLTDSEEKENSAAHSDDHVNTLYSVSVPFYYSKTIPEMTLDSTFAIGFRLRLVRVARQKSHASIKNSSLRIKYERCFCWSNSQSKAFFP
jgi:hypothetical protein